ncbi:hypothetical protein CYMTET_49115 [Cymbomonas tetramitiformis]|uniref:VPS37 C-terminal domain-containing protein n=1 Tax=Cymbomonas tetramitiformis TaxID=36881 RepID=A0AAE0BSJ0_9CHLO|nr:hypothetical protein CYMTET_49115 [Cymbomonas tetramitiformis]
MSYSAPYTVPYPYGFQYAQHSYPGNHGERREREVCGLLAQFPTARQTSYDRSQFEVLLTLSPGRQVPIQIFLPPPFPLEPPQLTVPQGVLSHRWVEPNGRIMNERLRAWNPEAGLALVVREAVEGLQGLPTLPVAVPPAPEPQIGPAPASHPYNAPSPPSYHLLRPQAAGVNLPSPSACSTSPPGDLLGPPAAQPPPSSSAALAAPPTPSSAGVAQPPPAPGSAGIAQPPRKATATDVSQLDHLSNEDLARILTDDQAFLDLVSHIQLTTLARTNSLEATEELRAQNVQLANKNLDLVQQFKQTGNVINVIRATDYNQVKKDYDNKVQRQQKVLEHLDPRILLRQLTDSAKKLDEQSEDILEQFENGQLEIEQYVEQYLAIRHKYHTQEYMRADIEPKIAIDNS